MHVPFSFDFKYFYFLCLTRVPGGRFMFCYQQSGALCYTKFVRGHGFRCYLHVTSLGLTPL